MKPFCKKLLILLSAFCPYLFSVHLFAQVQFHHPILEKHYAGNRLCKVPLAALRISHVDSLLRDIQIRFPPFKYEEIGRSVEDRPVYLVKIGSGKIRVLLWSQMHGDEPTATAALLDIFNYLMTNGDAPFVKTILNNLTILAVPMLNPDGAERFTRRNAQGLDINRDAREQVTPEGRLLVSLKDKYRPEFGFNLHDQGHRRTVGETNRLVGIALMAPPFDSDNNDNPVRLKAKQIVSVIYQAAGPYLYGHIAKYDAGYMPRAFGDAMQNWGVSTILVESGGWYSDRDNFLQKMNFIALLAALHAIAGQQYLKANPAVYEVIPENDKELYDLLIRDITIIDGSGNPAFRTDLAINHNPVKPGLADSPVAGTIVELGDLDYFAALDTLNGAGMYLTPGFIGFLNPDWDTPSKIYNQLEDLLKNGYTTIIILISPDKINLMVELNRQITQKSFPGNLGYVLRLEHEPVCARDSLEVLKLLSQGFLGLVVTDSASSALQLAKWVRKPAGILHAIEETTMLRSLKEESIARMTANPAKQWELPRRGLIRNQQVADLLLFSKRLLLKPELVTVFVNGRPVVQDGVILPQALPGQHWLPD